jgi:Predicted membrane protein
MSTHSIPQHDHRRRVSVRWHANSSLFSLAPPDPGAPLRPIQSYRVRRLDDWMRRALSGGADFVERSRVMRLIFAVPTLALLAVACSEPVQPAPEAAPAAPAPVLLAGVDLNEPVRLLGTEPFWSVDITETELVYTNPEPDSEQRAARPEPVLAGTTATWTSATTAGVPLVITVIATDCSDGMSDRTYPLVAKVELGTQILNGCAAQTSAIMSSGESGPVTTPPAQETPAA